MCYDDQTPISQMKKSKQGGINWECYLAMNYVITILWMQNMESECFFFCFVFLESLVMNVEGVTLVLPSRLFMLDKY